MQELTTFLANHPLLVGAALVAIFLLVIVELLRARKETYSVNVSKAVQLINHNNAAVIDIRKPELFKQGHIIDAVLMPAEELQQNSKKLDRFKKRALIIVCNTGVDSQKLAAFLLKEGYNAHSLAGGIRAWVEAQMPLVKEQK